MHMPPECCRRGERPADALAWGTMGIYQNDRSHIRSNKGRCREDWAMGQIDEFNMVLLPLIMNSPSDPFPNPSPSAVVDPDIGLTILIQCLTLLCIYHHCP